jgi:hypothetical protein
MPNNQAPPGVGIRRGSPVLPGRGVVISPGSKMISVARRDGCLFDESPKHYSLDLTDPTGRIHGVWAVAERQGLRLPAQSRLVHRSGSTWKIETPPDGPQGERSFVIFSASQAAGSLAVIVPELRDIPNEQPQQALAAIMRHVFGDDNAK